jgi:hypothetical protein
MMTVRALAWESSEDSPQLTPEEVDILFDTTQQLASLGMLSEGKYVGATKALYWQRIQKGD